VVEDQYRKLPHCKLDRINSINTEASIALASTTTKLHLSWGHFTPSVVGYKEIII